MNVKENWMTRGLWLGVIVVAACVGLADDLLAFSVGEIAIQSAANEPFRAEVPFVLESHERDRELEVLLGTPQDYQLEELERAPILEHLHIIVAPDKRDTLRIFSNVPVTDEAFELLVLVRSGKLTIVRNYHVELPESMPTGTQPIAAVEPATRTADPDPATSLQPAAPAPSSLAPEPVPPPTLPAVEAQLDLPPDLYGPIQRGETMYNIVGKLNVPRTQRWQAVVLLWRMNHEQFLRGNLHGLRVGAYLEVPTGFVARLNAMNMETSQQIIDSQWQAWRRRQVTTAAQARAMSMELDAPEQEPTPEPYAEPVYDPLPQPVVMPQVAEADMLPEAPAPDDGPVAVTPPPPPAVTQVTDTVIPPEEPVRDDGAPVVAPPQPAAVPQAAEAVPPPEEPIADDSIAAVAPPQVVRLPTDEESSFVSTQELKMLLGNLEDRLLRRLAPVQEPQGTTPFVSSTELRVSLQDLENRLTQRVEQMMAREGTPLSPTSTTQPSPAVTPSGGIEYVAGVPMPPVAYLLTLINVVLLVFGLTLGWRWWRQNAKGEA